ncbi:hypothetical protein QQS21_005961 [Conoideocrella luteorostrata]|uniref:FAD-binding domain-containing protein n=1 Tax=Conoideocrella luteorostrata TaxID=1105319 RepID=A0AAJ0CRE1_9HYPO|nr:hypothetical protein QQS21_005961 [Conoideocrella luteorostrata]
MSNHKILIVGASIAGPMAAYWFAKAGASVTVIERFPQLRTGGQNIDIRLTGVTVMRKIPGMEDAVRAALAPLEGLAFVRDDGTPIATMKGTGNAEQQSLVSEFEIFRGELSRVLYDLTKNSEHVKYIFGEHIVSIQQQREGCEGPVKVEFANGTPSAEYDLVVACDGATSRTRAMGFGCGVRDHISPVGAWAAYFSTQRDLLNGGRIGLARSSPGGRALALGPDLSDSNRAIAMSVHPSGDDPELEKFRLANKQGTDELKRLVSQRFRGVGWKSEEILADLASSDDFYASEICQVKVPTLYKGRVVLVGDAGYAAGPTGTGTSLAMAGAYILAGEVSKSKQDFAAGLEAYQERMKPIIQDMHVIPPGALSFMAPQTTWGIYLRDAMFLLVCWGMRFVSVFSWLSVWGAGFGKDKYNLPDYDWER